MVMFNEILVAADASDQAQAVLRVGLELARATDAHLTVLHVNNGVLDDGGTGMDLKTQGLMRGVEKLPNASAVFRFGRPVAEIIAEAEERRATLIVMVTHGRGRLTQLVLGSTAEGVARMAPCPVMTIRQTARRKKAENPFKRILVAMDASE